MIRNSPIRHVVNIHKRGGKIVQAYYRGSRRRESKNVWKKIVGRVPDKINSFLFNEYRRDMWTPIPEGIKSFIESFGDVNEVYIAGSFVSNKDTPKDIDILILYPASKNIQKDDITSVGKTEFHLIPNNSWGNIYLDILLDSAKEKYGENYEFVEWRWKRGRGEMTGVRER